MSVRQILALIEEHFSIQLLTRITKPFFTRLLLLSNTSSRIMGYNMSTIYHYLDDNQKKAEEERKKEEESHNKLLEKIKQQKKADVNFEGFNGKLSDLVDGIRSIPNYNNLKGYVREKILPKNPGISYQKLSIKAGIHKGVALVILHDLYNDKLEEELKEIEEKEDPYHSYS